MWPERTWRLRGHKVEFSHLKTRPRLLTQGLTKQVPWFPLLAGWAVWSWCHTPIQKKSPPRRRLVVTTSWPRDEPRLPSGRLQNAKCFDYLISRQALSSLRHGRQHSFVIPAWQLWRQTFAMHDNLLRYLQCFPLDRLSSDLDSTGPFRLMKKD